MVVEKSEYNGKPVLVIKKDENDRFPFTFGYTKGKMIVDNIEEIKKFVTENEPKKT